MKLYVYACDVEMNNEDHQEDSPSIEVLFLTYLIRPSLALLCFHLVFICSLGLLDIILCLLSYTNP